MNPQQPEDYKVDPAQPENQPAAEPQSASTLPTPTPDQPLTAPPPENHVREQPAVQQPVTPTAPPTSAEPVHSHSPKKLKKAIIIALTIVAIILLVPVFIAVVGAPKLKQASNDTAIKNDVATIASELNKYNVTAGSYPAVTQFYDGTFKPEGVTHLNSSDAVNYVPTPQSCDANAVPCTGFTLTTKLDSGKDFSVSN